MESPKLSTRTLQKRLAIRAPASAVWKALTEAGELARWFPTSAECDARPGGAYRFHFESATSPGASHDRSGQFLDVVPPKRLSFTWRAPLAETATDAEAPETRVEFALVEKGGLTDIVLTHTGFGYGGDWDRSFERHSERWGFYVMNLRSYLERGVDTRARDLGLSTPHAAEDP
jgi:uncharacterized protein YndB with AHSA1/START domain